MTGYVRRRVWVDAFRFRDDMTVDEARELLDARPRGFMYSIAPEGNAFVGGLRVERGEWIVFAGDGVIRVMAHTDFVATYEPPMTDALEWVGRGQRAHIGTTGHVDLAAFTEAADALYRRDIDGAAADDQMPSAGATARHMWLRPLTIDWAKRRYKMTTKEARDFLERQDAQFEPCSAEDDGAVAYTVIDVDN